MRDGASPEGGQPTFRTPCWTTAPASGCSASFGIEDSGARSPFGIEVRRRFPFEIRKVQTDHGAEFPLAFVLTLQEAGIRHRYSHPRRPPQNGRVERSHRIDQEEFWGRGHVGTFLEANSAVQAWERVYNVERFARALRGETPAETVARRRPGFLVA